MAAKPKDALRLADVPQRDNPIRSTDGDSISFRTESHAVHRSTFDERHDIPRRGRGDLVILRLGADKAGWLALAAGGDG